MSTFPAFIPASNEWHLAPISRDDKFAGELATVDKALEGFDYWANQVREAVSVGDVSAAEYALGRAQAANSAAKHYRNRAAEMI